MGTNIDTVEFDGKLSASEIKIKFRNHQDDCSNEDGNSYSGLLNMCSGLEVEDKVFDNYNEADEYLSSKAQKWENAIAVRYKVQNPIQDSAKTVKLRAKSQELNAELIKLTEELQSKTILKIKSKPFHTCTGCKSKVNSVHILRTECRVCGGSLLVATDMKKIERLKLKITQNNSLIQADRKSMQDKANSQRDRQTRWLILGLCSS